MIVGLVLLLGLAACQTATTESDRAAAIVAQMRDPQSKRVLVASHRGDWRNFPENSLPALRNAIDMGVDIVEIDLQMTRDSMLVLMHDPRIDRTTTGKGRVADIDYDSIGRVRLRAGHGAVTPWGIPTLEEALQLCKGRAVVNIDKGFQYYDLIRPLLETYGMLDQTLIKGRLTASQAGAAFSKYDANCIFMPIVNFSKPRAREILESYREPAERPVAYEICWSEFTPEVEACMKDILAGGSKLWVNALWPALNGGICDDAAVEGDPAEVYGRLVGLGATMIQTDRPALLIDYLRTQRLHD